MIDLETCSALEFKRWTLDNVIRWVSPEALMLAVDTPNQHGYTLIGYSDVSGSVDRFQTKLPYAVVKATYHLVASRYEEDAASKAQALILEVLRPITGACETRFIISRNAGDGPCLIWEIEVAFTVLNYSASRRTAAREGAA